METTGGGGSTVNRALLVADPAWVVTIIGPVVALVGTTAVIWVAERAVKLTEWTPLKRTAESWVKFDPKIVTVVPGAPLAGENELIVGLVTALHTVEEINTEIVFELVPPTEFLAVTT